MRTNYQNLLVTYILVYIKYMLLHNSCATIVLQQLQYKIDTAQHSVRIKFTKKELSFTKTKVQPNRNRGF